ncbi:MAG: ATP-dependent DNA helicase RecG [Nostocoides sp.]
MSSVGPDTALDKVVGQVAGRLRKARGMETVADLLAFRPRRYMTWTPDLSALQVGMYAVVVATVASATTRRMRARRGTMLQVEITDGSRSLEVTFFNAHGHDRKLVPGVRAVFAGQVTAYREKLQLAHPDYEIVHDSGELAEERRGLLPIYTRIPRVANWTVKRAVDACLDVLEDWPDPVPGPIRDRRGLLTGRQALTALHRPTDLAAVTQARHTLAYHEAFLLQVALGARRAEHAGQATTPRVARPDGLLAAFDAGLPWPLTEGQMRVGEEIFADLAGTIPMHRLLQGEVGSGKTVVALRAMLAAVDSGGQAALLAPTEVLAAQHYRSIVALLGPLGERGLFAGQGPSTGVVLLTGSQSSTARRAALLAIVTGEAGIVIGTHALIQQAVTFEDLALVVVDEQHRFGVEQRDALRAKGTNPPHVLVMTATPIPRTVAMTVFGDMETSVLSELPGGRAPITTHVVPADRTGWLERTWARVAEEVQAGRQAYVVCPRIHPYDTDAGLDGLDEIDPDATSGSEFELWDPGDTSPPPRPVHAVTALAPDLAANPALSGIRIGMLHGQLPTEEKDAVMAAFTAGQIDVLVATTVIEVGVDVPNASVMVIMDADRFGVSQLHQLRGRVGRGGYPGLCLLVSATTNETSQARLDAVAATSDGFELARLDVEQRREGDVLGTGQHGRSSLEFLSLLRDEALIASARADAFDVVAGDPSLADYPELAAAVASWLPQERAVYLERG